MRCASTILAVALSLMSTAALADNTLRSATIKKSLCGSIEVELYDQVEPFSQTKCQAGTFTIARSVRDTRTNAVTLMDINYSMTMLSVTINGKAQVAAAFAPDRNGQMVQTWNTRSTASTVTTNGDIIAAITATVNSEDIEIDVHNGDYSIGKRAGYTAAKARKDLETSLENNPESSCVYETYEGVDSTLGDYTFKEVVPSVLMRQLEQASRQKKIKAALHRVYEDGESEYCSYYYYTIIFTDGTVLDINVDQTT